MAAGPASLKDGPPLRPKGAAKTAAQGFAPVRPSETVGGEEKIIGFQVGPNEMIKTGPDQIDKRTC